jgi:hypothetical protein
VMISASVTSSTTALVTASVAASVTSETNDPVVVVAATISGASVGLAVVMASELE